MSIKNFLDGLKREGDAFVTADGGDWMQGRTMYGGASSLLAYAAATRTFTDLPPLRAAQVGFVGPVGAESTTTARILRQGRSVTQVETEIHSNGALAHRGLWLFGSAREANAEYPAGPPEPRPLPVDQAEELPFSNVAPSFIGQYEIRRAQESSGKGDPIVRRWFRLKDREGLDPIAEMVLVGDTLPPGSMRQMQRRGPISSINWSFNILDTEPVTHNGWWLAETAGEHAADGFSSERLKLWNSDEKLVMTGFQCAAIFG
ncbi:thioesterase family protein [Altererythrobacter sp. ZODW24]|uniref:thioesterase family protein n=1 Tax=Altererythrobacter sp. ZODW24 TaxID=2185142 RepID=UPI000DF7282D|nr:thioesterase family protein [Altererythrobacter sp. ZODW24]